MVFTSRNKARNAPEPKHEFPCPRKTYKGDTETFIQYIENAIIRRKLSNNEAETLLMLVNALNGNNLETST